MHEWLTLDQRIVLVNNNDPSIIEIELPCEDEGDEAASEHQIRAILRGLRRNTYVQRLDLNNTPDELRQTVCNLLLPLLFRENRAIQYIRFPYRMSNEDFEPAADVLCNNNNAAVKNVDLSWCNIGGQEGGEIVARLIRSNHGITAIDLSWNEHLGAAAATHIAAALGDYGCALKTLNLAACFIGNEGMAALFTALRTNNSLEKIDVTCNRITEENYRALARFLPHMSRLLEIKFLWEPPPVSAACVQQMIKGLKKNQSLQCITAYGGENLSEEQRREWETCCAFVGARNKMNCRLLDEVLARTGVAAREGRGVAPMPIPIGPLLWWCRRRGNSEVQASLIHPLLCSRANEIAKFAEARLKVRHSNRRRKKVDYLRM